MEGQRTTVVYLLHQRRIEKSEFAKLIREPKDLKQWILLEEELHKVLELKNDLTWSEWANSEFFKAMTTRGRIFGKTVAKTIKGKSGNFLENLYLNVCLGQC